MTDSQHSIATWAQNFPDPRQGWRDMIGQAVAPNTGPTIPTWTQIASSPFSAYKFALNDQLQFVYHFQHDYRPGTAVYLHAHWISDGTDTTHPIKWEFTWTYAKGFNQANYNFSGTIITIAEASGGQYRHMVTECATPISSDFETDGNLIVRLRRVTNGGVNSTDGIYLLTSDCHYQAVGIATTNRIPPFEASP